MKLFRHQPLLVWTLVLVSLLAILGVGLLDGSGSSREDRVEPMAETGHVAAEELLARLPAVHATIEAGTYPDWIAAYADFARKEASEHRDENPAVWNAVVAAVSSAESADPQDRPRLLGALSDLNSAVFSLARSYR